MIPQIDDHTALESLRIIARHGSLRAAEALGAFSGNALTAGDAEARLVALPDVPMLGGDPEQTIVGIHIGLDGDLEGSVLASFSLADAATLLTALGLEVPDGEYDDLGRSALGEAGNIIVSAFLGTLDPLCGLTVLPTPPQVVVEMRGAILTSAVLPVVDAGGDVLLINAAILPVMTDAAPAAACEIIFLPTPDSWAKLSHALMHHALQTINTPQKPGAR
jgi:chemotaxis protein CheC